MGSSSRPISVPRLKMHRPYTAKSVRRPPTANVWPPAAAALKAHQHTSSESDEDLGAALKAMRQSFIALDRQRGTGIVPADEVDVVLRTYNIDTASQVIRQLMKRCAVSSGGIDFHCFTNGLGVKLGLPQQQQAADRSAKRPTTAAVSRPRRFKFEDHEDTFQRVMPEGRTISQPATPWNPGKRVDGLENAPKHSTFSSVMPPHLKSVRKADLAAVARGRSDGSQTPPADIGTFEWFQHLKPKGRPSTAKPVAGAAWRVSPSQTQLQRRSNGWPDLSAPPTKATQRQRASNPTQRKMLAYGLKRSGAARGTQLGFQI